MLLALVKQPAEVLTRPVAFTSMAPIAAIADVAVQARGLVPSALPMAAVTTLVAGAASVELSGGADGERYLVTIRATDAQGEELESELDVAVVDTTWALPDGGAPYLSILGFVERFGFDEVVAMTDANGSGRIDRTLLTRALADAQAIVEGFIAARYALPLASVPPLVELWIADIARARLYPRGAPDGVATNAAAAMASLKSVQAGTTPLPVAGAIAPEAPTETPILVVAGRRAYPDALVDY